MGDPGRLLTAARRAFGDERAARVFEPLLADWRHERQRAESRSACRALTVRWTAAALRACLLVAWEVTLRPTVTDPPGWRAAGMLALFCSAGLVLLIAPFVRDVAAAGLRLLPVLPFLVPQALAIAVPFALLPAAMVLGGAADVARSSTRCRQVAALALAGALVSTATTGWVMPASNQAFREHISPSNVPPGLRERSSVELWNTVGSGTAAARQELRTRLSVGTLWPLALACLGWRLGRRRVGVSAGVLLAAWAGAALLAVVTSPLRVAGRDIPTLLVPWLWLLTAVLVRPRDEGTGPELPVGGAAGAKLNDA